MDVAWALNQLEEYLRLHERVPLPLDEQRPNKKTRVRGSDEELSRIGNVVRAIWDALFEGGTPRYVNEEMVRGLIWELTEGDEVRSRLAPEREPPPAYKASSMHPWVWEAARSHWLSGNYDAAVWAAGVNVNSRLQNKVGRKNAGEGQLIRESFSTDDPKPAAPRLRLCDRSNPDLFRDRHAGAISLGQGLYSAVRNPLNHVGRDEHAVDEVEAMESLAAFSLLARWIERAEVVRAASDDEGPKPASRARGTGPGLA